MPTSCPRCDSGLISYNLTVPLVVRQGKDLLVRSVHVMDENPRFEGTAACDDCTHEFRTEDKPDEEWPAWDFGP